MRSLRFFPATAALVLAAGPLFAQTADAPPVDASALLKELQRLREQQATAAKQTRTTVLQQIASAASNPERALALWEEAVRAVQFDGKPKEGAAFREWKDREGEALSAPLGRNAVRLFFVYLGITIQRDGGASVKELLPQLLSYARELASDETAVEALEDSIKRERELGGGNRRQPPAPQRKVSDEAVRRAHDQVLKRPLGSSPVVQWMKLADFVDAEKWEKQPGNFDGIYTQIILPELRAQKDPRALEYWDYRLKRDGEAAVKSKLAFEIEKFNTLRRPTLLWSRAQELLAIGQKNRAVGEMFAVIRANPANPGLPGWIAELESVLAPPPAETSASPEQPAAPVVK